MCKITGMEESRSAFIASVSSVLLLFRMEQLATIHILFMVVLHTKKQRFALIIIIIIVLLRLLLLFVLLIWTSFPIAIKVFWDQFMYLSVHLGPLFVLPVFFMCDYHGDHPIL